MGYTNSGLVSYTKISPNRNSPRNHAIDTVTVHCVVGQLSVETMGDMFARSSYQASCNYCIGSNGSVGLIVPESDRSWCTSSRENDNRAVTIECASDATDPYAVNSKVYATLIDLLADICRRNGIGKLVWSTDKNDRLDHRDGCNMTVHRDYANKACPGEYLYSRHGQIAEEVNAKLGSIPAKPKATTDRIWLGWTPRESGTRGSRCTNGDGGKAQGKYQFDYRYALVPFMEYCVAYDPGHYAGFQPYIAYGAGNAKLVGNAALATLWQGFCDDYPTEFEQLQDTYAYRAYYLEAKKYIRNLFGVNMDSHSPAVKGTLFSMAIRSGALCAAQKFSGCTDATSDADMLGVAYGTYGSQDGGRWTRSQQWGDALAALEAGTYTEVATDMASGGEILPETDQPWLRVGTAWKNGKCTGQAGAFHDRDKADRLAGAKAVEEQRDYYVFDDAGKVLYTAHGPAKEYVVQAGSFTDSRNADNLADRIKAAGFEAIVKGEDGWYKVQCGSFAVKANADALVEQLEAVGFEAIAK